MVHRTGGHTEREWARQGQLMVVLMHPHHRAPAIAGTAVHDRTGRLDSACGIIFAMQIRFIQICHIICRLSFFFLKKLAIIAS